MKTISLLNMKGGVGKTTTSLNLAAGLALKGKRVLLVDYDPQANTTSIFQDEPPETSINEIMTGVASIKDVMIKVDDNLWLVPSELALTNTEMEMRAQTTAPQHNRLEKALAQVKDQFDYCIIDCAPAISLLTVNAIIASNHIIVPIKPDKFAVKGFVVTNDNIQQIKKNWELDLSYSILFTIINRNNEEREVIRQLREMAGSNVFQTEIRSQPKPIAAASLSNSVVIRQTGKDVGVAEDMRKLVDEIMGVL